MGAPEAAAANEDTTSTQSYTTSTQSSSRSDTVTIAELRRENQVNGFDVSLERLIWPFNQEGRGERGR